MKKIFLPAIFFLMLAASASAQVKRTSRHRNTTNLSVTTPAEEENKKNVQTFSVSEPDNRKEYMQDGQLATYTGHEATPVNAEQFQSPKKEKPIKKEED